MVPYIKYGNFDFYFELVYGALHMPIFFSCLCGFKQEKTVYDPA